MQIGWLVKQKRDIFVNWERFQLQSSHAHHPRKANQAEPQAQPGRQFVGWRPVRRRAWLRIVQYHPAPLRCHHDRFRPADRPGARHPLGRLAVPAAVHGPARRAPAQVQTHRPADHPARTFPLPRAGRCGPADPRHRQAGRPGADLPAAHLAGTGWRLHRQHLDLDDLQNHAARLARHLLRLPGRAGQPDPERGRRAGGLTCWPWCRRRSTLQPVS